jgi:hypothetical protein
MKTLARERDRAEILRRLRSVRPESARRWGRMSAHQMICHLGDSFRMAMGQKAVRSATSPFKRTVIKWIALYAPLPWPGGIPTTPEIDQEVGGTKPGDFAADVAEVEALLEQITAHARSFGWQAHPTFGPMSDPAWLRWGYIHTDHHLRQFGAEPPTPPSGPLPPTGGPCLQEVGAERVLGPGRRCAGGS